MSLSTSFIGELQSEAVATRKILATVPADKAEWIPHAKSMKLGRLATHVAELPLWIVEAVNKDELDFSKGYFPHPPFSSSEELVGQFDKNLNDAIEALKDVSDEKLNEMWTLRNGEHVYFTMPKKIVIRSMGINHFIYHRGQLGVYLRLLDTPIPGMYGPSADDKLAMAN